MNSLPNEKNRWKILPIILLGPLMGSLDSSIVNVALPTLTGIFGVEMEWIQWIVSSYLITISAFILVAGKLSDLVGRVRIFKYGFVIFGLGSVFCALSLNLPFMIFARVIQALGAAMFMSSNQAIIASIFPPNERGQALGLLGTTVAVGTMIGPPLGGFIVTYLNWNWLFLVNIPVVIFAIITINLFVPGDKINTGVKIFDFWGCLLFVIMVICFFYLFLNMNKGGWFTTSTLIATISGVICLALFIIIEKRHSSPMMDLNLFNSPYLIVSLVSVIIVFSASFCINITQPFYLENVSGLTPARAGLILLATPVLSALSAPLGGYLADRFHPEPLTLAGLCMEIIALIGLSFLKVGSQSWVVILFLCIFGTGVGVFNSPNTKLIMSSVHPSKMGVAGSMNALARNFGMVSGVAIAVSMSYGVMRRQFGYDASMGISGNKAFYVTGMKSAYLLVVILLVFAVLMTLISMIHKKNISEKE